MSQINMLDEISNYIYTGKYARYNEDKKRRETWKESVNRSLQMHLKKFKGKLSEKDIEKVKWAFQLVEDYRVAGSMRSLQFAGKAIESKNAKIYNCTVRHIDSIRSFAEVFWLALNGCGTGFGLYHKYLDRIPDLVNAEDKTGTVVNYVVIDTIEGWADSIEALLSCYFKNNAYTGRKIAFDYSRIRKKGSPLKTTGGKAPGYRGLKKCHQEAKALLDHIIESYGQTRLKSIDAYDILCHCMDAVLSGGIRRSAASAMFDMSDTDMMKAKTGDWLKTHPHRARTNNSVLLLRDEVTYDQFKEIVEHTKQYGEPAFVFADNLDVLFNPCFEVSFIPVTIDGVCGCQFCNLSTINGARVTSREDFLECVEASTIIGTLQAAYTDFSYLGNASKQLTEEEALLGVSITGMMDNPDVLLNPKIQKEGAELAVDVNKLWAKKLGIKAAARVTVIKPEGTSSLVFKSASGIHPHHAHKYFRRIQANKLESVYKYFKKINPHMCEESVWSKNKTDDVIIFPVEVPKQSKIKADYSALEHLAIIKSTQKNWVNTGSKNSKKPINHNVSCTVIVKANEWDDVCSYIFKNREYFTAVSLIAHSGDKDYKQAPNEAVVTPEDEARYKELLENYKHVDFTQFIEEHDDTALQQEASCAGGKCEL